jgi:hypothetical protein
MDQLKKIVSKMINFLFAKNRTARPTENYYGSISIKDEEGVKQAIQLATAYDGPIIEIGLLFGHTTNFIASIANPSKKIIAVDNFQWNPFGFSPESHEQFTRRTIRYILEHRNTELLRTDSSSFFNNYSGPTPSMIFIDADHSYEAVKADISAALKMGIPVISGHDFSNQHEGVQRAVNESFKENFQVYGTVWVSKVGGTT